MEAKKYRRIFTIVVDSCGIGGAKMQNVSAMRELTR